MAKCLGGALARAVAGYGASRWERFAYRFDFSAGEYFWGGDRVSLTDTEAVYLFERLVEGKKQVRSPQTMYQLQRKFGKAFMAEIFTPGEKKRRGPGRKTDLEYEIEGNWFTKDGKPRWR
jgi:hypothetical protein